MADKKLKILVSSTVYGIEGMLEDIYSFLNTQFEVWMSHMGTVTVYPTRTALESCIQAVDDCDLFLSIITTQYGSGVLPGELSITHQELLQAIELEKPRWILAHDHVVFTRALFEKFGASDAEERDELITKMGWKTKKSRRALAKRKKHVLDDFRVIDMYDDAARHDISIHKYKDRKGNWVQKFRKPDDGLLFTTAQFGRYAEIKSFLEENLGDAKAVRERVGARRDE
jgi:hypothetical protein